MNTTRETPKGTTMNKLLTLARCAPIAVITLAACQDERPTGPQLVTEVAPLQLDGIGGASYTLTVRNGSNEIVWTASGLTSAQYGDGRGALTYIGTCDADDNPNSVELVLDALYDTTGRELVDPDDYSNPGPQTKAGITCKENADVSVVFDITMMRAAHQGFFDIAVNFEDIFCSAKADCLDEMLHDPTSATGARGPTAVVAVACTTGVGEYTYGYLSDLLLTCRDASGEVETYPIAVDGRADGNQGPVAGALYQWAQYSGKEFPAGNSFDKCFRTYALGLDLEAMAGETCTLDFWATAAPRLFAGNALPADTTWPVIHWSVDLVSPDGTLCDAQPLNGEGSGVTTAYVGPSHPTVPRPFTSRLECGTPPVEPPDPTVVRCEGEWGGSFVVSAAGERQAVGIATRDGGTLALGTLPSGATLAGCCLDACCQGATAAPSTPGD